LKFLAERTKLMNPKLFINGHWMFTKKFEVSMKNYIMQKCENRDFHEIYHQWVLLVKMYTYIIHNVP
jgi:predicted nucleic-acid-binding Zn-ribbon protein